MSHFWEALESVFLTASMTMMPVTSWGSWPGPSERQRMVTCNCVQSDVSRSNGVESKAYGVAVVPEIQDLEGNGRLRTLASLERCAGVEDCRAELQGCQSASHARNRGALLCMQTAGMGNPYNGRRTGTFWSVVQAPLMSSMTESE
jgi:hypothetical protein